MTQDEINNFEKCIQKLKTVSNDHDEILSISGATQDETRFYTITEARKVHVRIELQEEIIEQGKFSEKTACKVM